MALVPNQSAEARQLVKISRKSQFSGGCQRLQAEPPLEGANQRYSNIFSERVESKRVMSYSAQSRQIGSKSEKSAPSAGKSVV
jgi:hypothetical protein